MLNSLAEARPSNEGLIMSQLINRYSEGVFIVLASPFTENCQLDLSSKDSLVDFYLDSGVSGMTILGIMGKI